MTALRPWKTESSNITVARKPTAEPYKKTSERQEEREEQGEYQKATSK